MRTSVVANGSLNSSHCRVFDAEWHRGVFRQLGLGPPLLSLAGGWAIHRTDGFSEVTLNHEFELELDEDAGELPELAHRVLDEYSQRELEARRLSCERPPCCCGSTRRPAQRVPAPGWRRSASRRRIHHRRGRFRTPPGGPRGLAAGGHHPRGGRTDRALAGRPERVPAGHLAPGFDDETTASAGELAELNRNGLFTKESRPGVLTKGLSQRAYATGFCSVESAAALLAPSGRTDLVTVAHARGEASQSSIPLQKGDVATVLGSNEGPAGEERLRDWSREANDTLALLLAESWYVEIFDPVWGRNGVLLPAALTAT